MSCPKPCLHCPFNFKKNTAGADFDRKFTLQDVEAWTAPGGWVCHENFEEFAPATVPALKNGLIRKSIPETASGNTIAQGRACAGAALFRAGKAGVTKQEIIDFWVNELGYSPGDEVKAVSICGESLP